MLIARSVKRKYVKLDKDEFIRIANDSNSIQAIAEKTNMSYCGVRFRIIKIREDAKNSGKECPIHPIADGRSKK